MQATAAILDQEVQDALGLACTLLEQYLLL
jgi:hypothetical protein